MCKISNKSSNNQIQLELFQFPDLKKPVEVSFTAPNLSSFGGLHLLKGVNQKQNFIHRLSSHIDEWRNKYLLIHSIEEMITQRVFQIAAGYEDADDCDALRNDSMLKMCSGRLPSEVALASQPTMTRLENHVSHRELYDMGKEFVHQFVRSYKKTPAKIILDFDDSNSDTYGAQQLTFFNDYYGERLNVFGLMKRVITEIRKFWPNTVIMVRGDAMFCSHEFMKWSKDQHHVEFITGLSGNKTLSSKSKPWVDRARDDFKRDGKPIKRYYRHLYKAGTWDRSQWVITKVEYNAQGSNVRHIVTSMGCKDCKELYEHWYCKRGDCELYIKELKNGLYADRMSCSKFSANQFRLFLHAAAYILLLEAKQILFRRTNIANVTITTFREKVLLCAVRITELKTKIKVEFVKDQPIRDKMRAALRRSA